ncbi:ABC transporter substrate-binding protein [Scleromatobacter humisilvae]|uniref:ABC transporter substrate-binding protein n=1 Tax=Scleromatobacter humisilvae TaxID=2897159 RepID=A0A9X2C0U4_9BURK|nr:ABC transporter substrate-binding protein [Scleromatobacter humisilvae]MCK9685114.1 ABC transporter substrate-binding protein [Scleromatobacter humisilvae]
MSAPPRLSARARVTRRALAGAAWTLAWTLVWGCMLMMFANRAHAAPLTLAVSTGPVSLPIYVAQARGFFKDEGLDLRLRECSSGRECYQWLADGKVDIATAAELLVATGSSAHRELAIIATISASSYQIKLVARRSAKIAEAPQIRGKRIGTVPGSSAQYFLDNWLVYNDIDPGSVTVVGLPPDKLTPALLARDVDAIAIWEPLASTAALALGGDAVTFASPRVYTQHFNLVGARPVLQRREDDVARLLRALLHAQHVIQSEPELARALLAERLHLPPALTATAMENEDYRVRLDQSLVATMQSEARWAARNADAPGAAVDVLRAIDAVPLHRVDAAAVGLVQ